MLKYIGFYDKKIIFQEDKMMKQIHQEICNNFVVLTLK